MHKIRETSEGRSKSVAPPIDLSPSARLREEKIHWTTIREVLKKNEDYSSAEITLPTQGGISDSTDPKRFIVVPPKGCFFIENVEGTGNWCEPEVDINVDFGPSGYDLKDRSKDAFYHNAKLGQVGALVFPFDMRKVKGPADDKLRVMSTAPKLWLYQGSGIHLAYLNQSTHPVTVCFWVNDLRVRYLDLMNYAMSSPKFIITAVVLPSEEKFIAKIHSLGQ